MTEENNTVVEQVVDDAQQEQSSPEAVSETPQQKEDSSQEHNWREMRQSMDELKYRCNVLEEENRNLRTPTREPEEDADFTDEDIPTVGVTKKLLNKQEEKFNKILQQMRAREAQSVEDRLRGRYSDYDAVVNKKNLENLFSTAPELVKMLKANEDDPFEQALAAYKLLKKFGVPSEDSEKFKENQNKPRSVNSVGQTSALSQANAFSRGLTPELRKQLLSEMQEAAKQA